MIARAARSGRSGITLTEILIAILIMGVGLISLATLFPLGLLRMRSATQYGRTALLFGSAADEMDARSLLNKSTFVQTWYGPRDPFLVDSLGTGQAAATLLTAGNANLRSGLPIVYDPLWRAVTGIAPGTAYYDTTLDLKTGYMTGAAEARFGAAVIGGARFNVRNDPDGSTPSGHGLQRLTNYIPYSASGFTPLYPYTHSNLSLGYGTPRPDGAADVFLSGDDIVFNSLAGQNRATASTVSTSPLLPELSGTSLVQDFRFSWFFTGQQVDITNSSQFVGNIVVCDSRPLAYDQVTINGTTASMPAGEQVVEAVFGFGTNFGGATSGSAVASGAKRKVLLRWPVGVPDPQVRPGGWIADVTYERDSSVYATRYVAAAIPVPYVRCHWYQVSQRTEPETETAASPGVNAAGAYRRMVVTINSDVRAQTLLNSANTQPVHCNFALVMPSVVNVFPRAFEVH